jgi:TonB family protein
MSAVSFAQPNVYLAGGDVTAPAAIYRQEPQYSEQARIARLQGAVTLDVVIGVDGTAHDIRVVRSLGLGLDENAIATVATWRFSPGTKGGEAVAVETQVECDFRLPPVPGAWSLLRAQFAAPPGATQPSILHAPYPAPVRAVVPGKVAAQLPTVRVAFDVDTQGVPANVQIQDSSDPNANDEVMALIREWRFQSSSNNGAAVQSHAVFDFLRGGVNEMQIDMRAVTKKKQ